MRTKLSFLKEAVKSCQRESTKRLLKEGFERVARDADMLELVEWGIDDFILLSYSRE